MPPGLGISGGDGSLGVALPPQKVWQPLSWPSSWGGRQEARAQGPCRQMTGPRGQLGIREAGLWSFLMELHGPGGRGRGRRWRNWIVPGSRSEAQCYVTGFCNTTLGSSREIGGWRAAVEAGGCPRRQGDVLRVRSQPVQARLWHPPAARPARASRGGHAPGSGPARISLPSSVLSKVFADAVLSPPPLPVAQGP